MNIEFKRLFSPIVIAASFAVTIFLLILTYLLIAWSAPAAPDAAGMVAAVTIIPPPISTQAPEATPTFDPYSSTPTPTLAPGQVSIGSIVQISGTQGEGLHIRSQPGLSSPQLFLGFDTEAYKVMDGPRKVDGYDWYYLAAINDEKRTGWAASNFLTAVTNP